MKAFLFIFSCLVAGAPAFSQLKATPVCPPFVVDILGGTVNHLSSKSTAGEIQKLFPCASSVVEKDSSQCAGIFFKDKDIYFYTERNYIQIGETFKGKLSMPLLGNTRASLFNMLGNPKIKDVSWDAFQMQYGTLITYYNADGKVNKIQISNRGTEALKLCE